jgi:hypothetical protein
LFAQARQRGFKAWRFKVVAFDNLSLRGSAFPNKDGHDFSPM